MPELDALVVAIASAARPGEQVEAYASWRRDTDVRVFSGEIEQLATAESAGIGVRVITGDHQGFAYVGAVDARAGHEALDAARENAPFASPDELLALAVPDAVSPAPLALWRPGVASMPTAAKVAMALDLDRRTRAADSRIRQVVSADYSDSDGEWAVASSTGVRASSRRTTCSLSVSVLAGEGKETQGAGGYSVGRSPDELDVDVASGDAIERAVRLLGARKPKSQRLTVVLDRRVTATLLSVLAGTLSGEDVARGRSMFAGRLGEQVAVKDLSLIEDPTNPLAFGAAAFDAEGLACRPTPLIEGGRLSAYLYNTYAGRLAGMASTASAVRGGFSTPPGVGARALAIRPGTTDVPTLLGALGEGLFVQSISGVHSGVNRVSGDFSVGVQGCFLRDGAFGEPVREATIASTVQRMLLGVVAIADDVEWLPGPAAGVTLAIDDVALSGR
ncbi:MAG: TldD/PmbA family protein [Actinomycetota bacterium]|nr:TldD/PmbA family protein [Actinomycetota bacterium]